MAAQFNIARGVAHVQVGGPGDYSKFNVPLTDELRDYYNEQRAAGNTSDSFAGTATQYAPVEVEEKVTRRLFVRVNKEITLSK